MKKKKHLWLWILLAVVLVLAVVILCNRSLVWTLWCNWFGAKVHLDESTQWDGGETYLHVPYAEDSDAQYFDLYVPHTEQPAPLFVLIHGGGFISGDSQTRQAQFMYRYFRDHGYACASVNYRLALEAPFPGAVCDVKAAVRYLGAHAEEYGYDTSHVAIWGESAGGYLAVMTAVSAPDTFLDVNAIGETDEEKLPQVQIQALVDFYGVMDFPTMSTQFEAQRIPKFVLKIANSWFDTEAYGFDSFEEIWLNKKMSDWTDEERANCSVNYHAALGEGENYDLCTMICHGDADITVPWAQSAVISKVMENVYGSGRVIFQTHHGFGHAADGFYTDEHLGQVNDFIQAAFSLS